ncbi:hypothetical protein N836_16580 [Leptolyngbya sp. Heron Island J]|uniref:hypothetical protein n=1 Tax=Leptolyngbya sp. Heron Island J TaxID=1385935 RepID=UPI0003B95C1E|nr:hypothetical protein [Leptolyngbya sp. Heron Island J]ESA34511.1 hypothetical protein N836_16580 [Leptolyngbya sp. Heron Island J]
MVSISHIFQPGAFSLLGAAASLALMAPAATALETVEVKTEATATPTLLAQAGISDDLGIAAGESLLAEAETAIDNQEYDLAIRKLQTARENLNETSTSYQNIAAAFTGIDAEISSNLRTSARDAAQMRDQATLRQALIYRAQGQAELAVPLLVEIVQSQGPTRDLGLDAYQQLFELGFVSRPYRRTGSEDPSTAVADVARPLNQDDSPTGIKAAEILIAEAENAYAAADYGTAVARLQTARDTLNTSSSHYQSLFNTFTGIDRRVSSEMRQKALEAAELRDQATLQQALAHKAQQQHNLAIPLLVEVIGSQNPTRDLGRQAYDQLLEIGFVAQPYVVNEETATSNEQSN